VGETELLDDLRRRGASKRVLAALAAAPRSAFAPPELGDAIWANEPLPIGAAQTMSAPAVVAWMSDLLELTGDERVLDVGTGSGWHAAVLSRLAKHVWSIERNESLSRAAGVRLAAAGITNVTLVVGDGARGHLSEAPFDAINVAAAVCGSPPPALQSQLAAGGRMVLPLDNELVVVRRGSGGRWHQAAHGGVRFVPLISPSG